MNFNLSYLRRYWVCAGADTPSLHGATEGAARVERLSVAAARTEDAERHARPKKAKGRAGTTPPWRRAVDEEPRTLARLAPGLWASCLRRAEPSSLVVYAAEPGSRSEAALRELAEWTATNIPAPRR